MTELKLSEIMERARNNIQNILSQPIPLIKLQIKSNLLTFLTKHNGWDWFSVSVSGIKIDLEKNIAEFLVTYSDVKNIYISLDCSKGPLDLSPLLVLRDRYSKTKISYKGHSFSALPYRFDEFHYNIIVEINRVIHVVLFMFFSLLVYMYYNPILLVLNFISAFFLAWVWTRSSAIKEWLNTKGKEIYEKGKIEGIGAFPIIIIEKEPTTKTN